MIIVADGHISDGDSTAERGWRGVDASAACLTCVQFEMTRVQFGMTRRQLRMTRRLLRMTLVLLRMTRRQLRMTCYQLEMTVLTTSPGRPCVAAPRLDAQCRSDPPGSPMSPPPLPAGPGVVTPRTAQMPKQLVALARWCERFVYSELVVVEIMG